MNVEAPRLSAVIYDGDQGVVSITGVVAEVMCTNPHGVIRMFVKEKDGPLLEWSAEAMSPSILERRLGRTDHLKAGDVIRLEGWRARDGSNCMLIRKLVRTDGMAVNMPTEYLEVP